MNQQPLRAAVFAWIATALLLHAGSLSAQQAQPPAQPPAQRPEAGQQAEFTVAALDANPEFLLGLELPLKPAALVHHHAKVRQVAAPRQAVTADGVSALLLQATCAAPGEVTFQLGNDSPGRVVTLDDLKREIQVVATHQVSPAEHVAWAVYLPPATFSERAGLPKSKGDQSKGDQVENAAPGPAPSVPIRLEATYQPTAAAVKGQSLQLALKLVRPPVVLVHGLYQDPVRAWQVPPPQPLGQTTMLGQLEAAGFRVFMVDYHQTNGQAGSGPCRLRDNQQVVWKNPGGIAEALQTLRGEGVACTQVDVVGHSMGGLLTRAYIRGYPLPEPGQPGHALPQPPAAAAKNWYLRPNNFHQGDVRRLITFCTPHTGSDLVRLFVCFGDVCRQVEGEELKQAAEMLRVVDATFGMSSGAFLDQEPDSLALRELGATPVPAHAIACQASPSDFEHFRQRYRWDFLAVYCLAPGQLLEAIFRHEKMRQPKMATRMAEFLEANQQVRTGVMLRLMMAHAGNDPPKTTDPQLEDSQTAALALMCEAIFHGRQHDGAVSVESSLGGLPPEATTTLDGVLHSWAARYPAVQDRIVELLKNDGSAFSQAGFPAGEAANSAPASARPRPSE